AGRRIDELPGDAHARSRLAHAAFEDVTHPQLAPDLLHIDRLALIGERRVSGDYEQPADARETADDVLDHAISEVLLLRVAAQVGEGQPGDRRLIGKTERGPSRSRSSSATRGPRRAPTHPKDPQRPRDVFYGLLPQVLEAEWQLVADLVAHRPGHA